MTDNDAAAIEHTISLDRYLALLADNAALRDALRGLDSDEIRAIRARHKAWEDRVGRFGTPSHACVDRGTLLDALATARRALDGVEGRKPCIVCGQTEGHADDCEF